MLQLGVHAPVVALHEHSRALTLSAMTRLLLLAMTLPSFGVALRLPTSDHCRCRLLTKLWLSQLSCRFRREPNFDAVRIPKNRRKLLYSSSSDDQSIGSGSVGIVGIGDSGPEQKNLDGPTALDVTTDHRRKLMHEKLLELDCFTNEAAVLDFDHVVQKSMIDPTTSILVPSYDGDEYIGMISGIQKYGKSTIKTCQTFYYPKKKDAMNHDNTVSEQLLLSVKIAASRTARQIEFLYQRHKAQQTQWIRNHDIQVPSALGEYAMQLGDTNNINSSNVVTRSSSTENSKCFPFIVVLDNLRSAQNVGSIYRTADATKCQQVITIGITPNPCTGNGLSKIQKSSLGAELYVPTMHFQNATTALQFITETYPTYQIVCVETTSESIPYTDLLLHNDRICSSPNDTERNHINTGIVFVFGNEVTGVDVSFYKSQISKMNSSLYEIDRVQENRDGTVGRYIEDESIIERMSASLPPPNEQQQKPSFAIIEIPMYGTKNSLNVAVCVSIIIYEMIRQYRLPVVTHK